jgi:hypothetical protein
VWWLWKGPHKCVCVYTLRHRHNGIETPKIGIETPNLNFAGQNRLRRFYAVVRFRSRLRSSDLVCEVQIRSLGMDIFV